LVVELVKKIIGRTNRLASWLKNVKVEWDDCPKADVVIFESTNVDYLLPLCKKHIVEILDVPVTRLYLNFHIIIDLAKMLLSGCSFQVSYYVSLIKAMEPVIVITFIDNSDIFYKVARTGHHVTRFLAIQNAARCDVKELSLEKGRQIYLPEFACFGKYEIDLYSSKGAYVESFYPIGSLRESYYRRHKTKKKNINEPQQYDLCVVAEASPGWDKFYSGFEDAIGLIAQYAVRLSEEKGLTIVIAGKRDIAADSERDVIHSTDVESEWYKKYIGTEVLVTPRVRDQFTTYELISNSRLSLAMVSTALYEGASRGARVLFCNYSGNPLWDFPVDGMMSHKEANYDSFSETVMSILKMNDASYKKCTQDDVNYVIQNSDETPTDTFLEKHISKSVQDKLKNKH